MKRLLYILFALLTCAISISAQSSLHNFEDATLNAQWRFIQDGQTNYWTIGAEAGSTPDGGNALYITNGDGYGYTKSSSSVSWAYIPVSILPTDTISFSWKCYGESNHDYIYAYLLPMSATLPLAGSTSISSNRIIVGNSLNYQGDWQHVQCTPGVIGDYYLLFMWGNDGSAGSDPAGAIDNLRIPTFRYTQTCGDNLYWELADSILSIAGSGEMYDYISTNPAPWHDTKDAIAKVALSPNQSSVGDNAFAGCTNLTTVFCNIQTPIAIGDNAFTSSPTCYVPASYQSAYEGSDWASQVGSFVGASTCGDNLFWTLADGVLNIFGVGNMYSYSSYSNFPWYNQRSSITSVQVQEGVTSISAEAFHNYNAITSVLLTNTLTTISDYAFYNCYSLTSISFPENLTTISNYAFYNCDGLTSISFPENLTTISNYAFYDCDGLTSISFPENLTTISDYAFYNCDGLTSISFPENLTTISNYAFYDCDGLTSISFPENLTTISKHAFRDCDALQTITIPSAVDTIGVQAFYTCDALKVIWMEPLTPPGVGNNAFTTSPTCYVPQGTLAAYQSTPWANQVASFVEQIQEVSCATAVKACTTTPSLPTYIVRGYVTEMIQNYSSTTNQVSFWVADAPAGGQVLQVYQAQPLSSADQALKLGDYVELQGHIQLYNAIPMFTAGTTVEILTAPSIETQCGENLQWSLSDSILTIYGSGAMYNYTSEDSAPWTEFRSSIKHLVLPEGLTTIGSHAFRECDALVAVALPTTLTSVGEYAFQHCSALAQLLIPDGVQSLGNYAFHGCSALASVYAQAQTPPTLGNAVFNSKPVCYMPTGLLATYQASSWNNFATSFAEQDKKCGDNLYWQYADGVLTIVGSGAMTNWSSASYLPWYSVRTNIHTVVLPAPLTTIGNYAFCGCSNLVSIQLPDSITTIGSYAFSSCSKLSAIHLPATITRIGIDAFSSTKIYNDNLSWDNNVLYIGNYLIATKSALSGDYTIRDNTRLVANYAFSGRSSLTKITIPNGVKYIGAYAFSGCSSLTTLYFPSSVEHIGNYAFNGANKLTFVDLVEGLQTIGAYAFYYCQSLPFITIPSTVTSIGDYAFYTNRSSTFTAVYMHPTTPPTLGGTNVFYSTATCYIPCGAKGAYLASSAWSNIFGAFVEQCDSDNYHTFDSSDLNAQWQFIQDGQTNHWIIGIDAGSASSRNKALYITNDGSTFAYDNLSASVSWAYTPVTLAATDSISFSWKGEGETCCDYVYAYLVPAGSLPTAGSTTLPEGTITISSKLNQQTTWQYVEVLPQVEGSFNLCFMWTNDESTGATAVAIDDVRIGNVPASAGNKCGDNLYWSISGTTLIITGSGDMYEYARQNMIPWYNQRTALDAVSLPGQLTSISRRAFHGCSALKSINIPQSLTHIGSQAFLGCTSLASAINLPEGITAVYDSTFYNCLQIPAVTLPEGITYMGSYAFYSCDAITSVVIPNSVTLLGNHIFYDSQNLKTVTIGSNVDSIANYAFYNTSLDYVYVYAQTPPALGTGALYSTPKCYIPIGTLATYQASAWANYVSSFVEQGQCGDNLYYTIENNTLILTGSGSMYDYSVQSPAPWYSMRDSIHAITLPAELTTIGNWAFYNCDSIAHISLPESLTSIGTEAFYDCYSLTSIYVPNNVTTIGYEAFASCTALTTATLGESVTSIGEYAFANCSALTAVELLAVTPPTIGEHIFSNAATPICYIPCGRTAIYQASAWASVVSAFEEECYDVHFHNFEVSAMNGQWQFVQDNQTNQWTIGTAAGSVSEGSYALYISNDGTSYNYNRNSTSVSWAYVPVTLTVTDTISFNWKGYGESSYDYLRAYLAPTDVLPTAGSTTAPTGAVALGGSFKGYNDWQFASFTPGVYGAYNLLFMWRNDGGGGGTPIAVDDIRFGAPAGPELTTAIVCHGESYTWDINSTTYTESGIYTHVSQAGEVYMLDLTVAAPAMVDSIAVAIHPSEFYEWRNGESYNQAGIYRDTLQAVLTACDSIIYILNLSLENINDTTKGFICYGESYTWSVNATTYTESGIYTYTNEWGDNYTLNLTVSPQVVNDTTIASMYLYDTYQWYGSTYSVAGTYTHTEQSIQGCDSITHILMLSAIASDQPLADYYDFENAALNAQWQFIQNGQTNYWTFGTAAGSYGMGSKALYITNNGSSYTYNTSSSSVSWAYIPVTLSASDTISFCWKGYGEGSYDYLRAYLAPTDVLPRAGSTTAPTGAVSLSSTLKSYNDWQLASFTPGVSGTYNLLFMWRNDGSGGSSPAAIDNLRIRRGGEYTPSTYSYDVTICYGESYIWQMSGETFSTSGSYTYTNEWGDIHILNLTISAPAVSDSTIATIYETETYQWYGSTYNVTGTYTNIEQSIHGCDSIIHILQLEVLPIPTLDPSDYHNFEDLVLNTQWQFIQNGQTNYWMIGTAAGSYGMGSKALYITNDGTSYNYNKSSSSVSWAYVPVTLTATDTISFNWKGYGEGSYDYLRAYLAPTDVLPTAGSTTAPTGAVSLGSYLKGYNDWQLASFTPGVSGTYNLWFMWKNDNSSGGTPAAVDNIRIRHLGEYTPNVYTSDVTICYGESYTWSVNATTYFESGSYSVTEQNGDTYILNLTVSAPTVYDTTVVTIYEGETYEWYDSSYYTEGEYVLVEQSIHDCDSAIHILLLSVEIANRCGENLTWSYSNGVLTISGYGAMYDYTSSSAVPWYEYRSNITTISLPDGITYIGNRAFYSCSALEAVQLQSATPPALGNYTFNTTPVCYIPCGSLLAYKASTWANIASTFIVDCGEDTGSAATNHDFESSSANAQWQFIQSGQTNYWTIGTAAGSNNGGSKALYITNDGSSYTYTNSTVSVAWAYIPVYITEGEAISFSWKGTGEGSYDFIRVYLLPQGSTLPSAGSESISNAITVSGQLSGYSSWQEVSYTPTVSGSYYLLFMWRNDSSAGSNPIAVDNVNAGSSAIQATNRCGDNLAWSYSDGVLTITGTGAMYDNHEQLSYRQQSWFPASLTQVNLPSGLTHIGATAFADCHNLTEITIPSTVTSIGQSAFMNTGLRSLTLPNSVNTIQRMAFAKCEQMTYFCYRATPTTLGDATAHMFLGCNSLDTIIAPASLFACNYADATLEQAYGLPSHATYIQVTHGTLSESALYYISLNQATLRTLNITSVTNTELPDDAFVNYTALQNLHLPYYLAVIPSQMAYGCASLEAISIPTAVQTIGESAFSGCISLRTLEFADNASLTYIGTSAFMGCRALTEVNLPAGLTSIGSSAFYECASLVKLHLPSSLIEIYPSAFAYCHNLAKMYVDAYTPPTLYENTFVDVPRTARLYVPESVVDMYKSAYIWQEFIVLSNLRDDVDNIQVEDQAEVQKLFINGKVFILKQGKFYNLMGQEIHL